MSKKRLDNVDELRPSQIAMVKVYDVNAAMKKWTENHEKGQHVVLDHGRFALIEGEKKSILVDGDGIHWIFDKDNISIGIGLVRDIPGGIPIVPEITVPLNNEMLDNMVSEEKELGIFVRHFSERIENNYRKLLDSIAGIGLDPDNYPRREIERESISKKRLRSI